MLTVHHLGKSQSERIVWLCEELSIPYELRIYERDSRTMLAPAEYKALHPLGAAPVITDGDVTLAESVAVAEYILEKYGNGRLRIAPEAAGFADFLYWFHFVNGTLQPAFMRAMLLNRAELPCEHPIVISTMGRLRLALGSVEARLRERPFLGGAELTVADIMVVFTLTTMRYFTPLDLAPYSAILAYLQRIAERSCYRSAMAKGDPTMDLLLT